MKDQAGENSPDRIEGRERNRVLLGGGKQLDKEMAKTMDLRRRWWCKTERDE